EVSRVVFLLARADVALREGELDEARRRLDRAEALLEETSATVHENALLEAHRARLLLAAEASPSELAGQLERLERAFGVLLERWAAAPSREGSIGFLHLGTRRLVLGALVRLTLALDAGRSGVEAAFGHVLAAQAKG